MIWIKQKMFYFKINYEYLKIIVINVLNHDVKTAM